MNRGFLLSLLILVASSGRIAAQDLYRWVDEKGVVHFTDDLTRVPERFRTSLEKKGPLEKPAPSPKLSPDPQPEKQPLPPAPEKRDLFGRDEAWWRAKVREWEDKLQKARENVERLQAEIRQKEKELAEVRLKPDKFKKKTKKVESEIKTLQAEAKSWEDQVNEAQEMLEKVLPKEAADSRADPEWLKPKEAGKP
ncbi:MAG: DUF4124 domain-containing protein [Desulfobacterota bacterium]|nr:DUF4124 domain-containing protein [Thermodesulfobacteriota bacterium]